MRLELLCVNVLVSSANDSENEGVCTCDDEKCLFVVNSGRFSLLSKRLDCWESTCVFVKRRQCFVPDTRFYHEREPALCVSI